MPFYVPPTHECLRAIVGELLPEVLDAIKPGDNSIDFTMQIHPAETHNRQRMSPTTVHKWTVVVMDGEPPEIAYHREMVP